MAFINDDDWQKKRLDLIREYVHVITDRIREREEEMNDEIFSLMGTHPSFTDAGLHVLYQSELAMLLTPILDLTEEWEADYLAQERGLPWHLVDDRRRTLYLIHQILRHDENVPQQVLSRACHCPNRTYRYAAAANPFCPEDDAVYVWLRENAEVTS